MDKGEFKKEGLDVTLKVLPTPDALPLLAKGDMDAMWAAPEAAVMNGVKGGFDIKWVAGNFSPDPKSKSGLWVKLKKGEAAADVRMASRRMGTMIGKGSVIAYPMEKALATRGGGLDKIQYQQLGSADVLTALQNGGVDSAWLLDPAWRKVDDNPQYAFLGGQPLGEPLGGMLYGPQPPERRRGRRRGSRPRTRRQASQREPRSRSPERSTAPSTRRRWATSRRNTEGRNPFLDSGPRP